MIILEENFKWHLEAFASELFIYNLELNYIGQIWTWKCANEQLELQAHRMA